MFFDGQMISEHIGMGDNDCFRSLNSIRSTSGFWA